MFQLSVCAETVFPELPFLKRVEEILKGGFFVEFWNWQTHDMDELASVDNLKLGTMNSSSAGSIFDPSLTDTFLKGVKENAAIANRLNCHQLIILAGQLNEKGFSFMYPIDNLTEEIWGRGYKTPVSGGGDSRRV